MVEIAASSYCLHLEKAALQALSPFAISETASILQLLTSSLYFVISSLVQHVQASSAVASLLLSKHFWASVSKLVTDAAQASTAVMFAFGKLAGLQVLLTSFSHSCRVMVRLAICLAPSESVDPEHERLDLLPPPTSISFLAIGPKTAFLPDFFSAISACFSILVFCFMKLATWFLHLLMAVVALSRHFPSTILPWALDPLFVLFLFLFVLFLFFLLFFLLLFFLFFLPFLFFLFLLPASASLAILKEEIFCERLCSSFSADAKTARTTRSPKRIREILLILNSYWKQ